MSTTHTTSSTFTRSSAKYLASKIAADLHRLQAYYGRPSDKEIEDFEIEATEFLANGVLSWVEYGFRKDGARVLTLRYEVRPDGSLADNNAGGVPSQADVAGASWYSFLSHNEAWSRLDATQQARIEADVPIKRSYGSGPSDGDGYWTYDRSYASDGTGTQRRTFRPA